MTHEQASPKFGDSAEPKWHYPLISIETLAEHQNLTLLAFCRPCDRTVTLDHQALAERHGADVLARGHQGAAAVSYVRAPGGAARGVSAGGGLT